LINKEKTGLLTIVNEVKVFKKIKGNNIEFS